MRRLHMNISWKQIKGSITMIPMKRIYYNSSRSTYIKSRLSN